MRTHRPAMVILSMLAAPLAMIALLMLALPAPVAAVLPDPGHPTTTFTFVPRSLLP